MAPYPHKEIEVLMRWSTCILLLVGLAGPVGGQTAVGQSYRNVNGNFSVMMPADPHETAGDETGGQVSHTIQAFAGSTGYTIIYVLTNADQPVDEATYRIYRDGFMKALSNCDVATETAASPAVPGYVGHGYRLNCVVAGKKMVIVGNLYWGKRYSYAVLVMFPAVLSEPAYTTKFLESFAVIDPSK